MASGGSSVRVDRVVAVVATLRDGREQLGSGYLTSGRLVLTAEHCTRDKVTGEPAARLRVVRASDSAVAEVAGVVPDHGLDVAVLRLADDAPWDRGLPPTAFARVDRSHSGVLDDCTGIGFPLFQRDPARRTRHTSEFHGRVYQTDERESGRLLMREPLIHPGRVTGAEGEARDDLGEGGPSPWGGLSGALMFYRGHAIGVVVEHHPRQGDSALRAVGFERIAAVSAEIRQCLGLPRPESLPWVSEQAVDADGPAGPRRRAELDAVAAYRQRMASRDGILEYSLLADDLPPMTYKPLADTLCVAVDGHDLGDADFLDTARRWPRMLLVGLPGMGKSTALEQAAARWAADASAPIPVLVPLRDLARRHPRRGTDITLPVLIEAATAAVPERERVPLRRALQEAATSGEAVLLLDGLDECRHRRAVVADGLAAVTGELPADTGVVLATRDSGLLAAARLNMPEARLTPPARLGSMLGQLLQHAAMFRVPEAERDQWVREREQQLEEIRSSHPDLWRIPLFATLLTLLIARPAPTTLPASQAQLLTEAVQETVDRWELTRLSETAPDLNVRAVQLLDGYGEIAHALIAESGGCPERGVSQRVETMLAERWALAPGEASARAREIMWFWDEHVGVFVASPTRDIEPRSRIFADAGDAMWAVSQDPGTRRDWIIAALTDDDRREAVIIAVGLSAGVASELIEAAGNAADPAAHSRGLLWAADATADGAEPATASLTTLIDALAHAADAAGHATSETPTPGDVPRLHSRAARRRWPYVLRIAMLPLPSTLRPRRDHALTALELDDNEQALATTLAALADARTDVRDILEPEQEAAVRRLLALPLPDRKPPPQSQPDRFVVASRQDKLLPGHHQAAEQAARYAAQLGQDAAAAIYRIARRGSLHDYARVCSRMIPLGYPDPEPPRVSLGLTGFAKGATDLWAGWEAFFAAAASLAPPRPLTAAECWRYPDIATLAGVLGAQEATLAGAGHAFTTDRLLLPGCIRAAAHAAALDLSAISAQAAIVLETWPEGNRDVINLMFAPPPAPLPACDASRLDQQDKDILIEALGATSDWLADIAYALLLPAHDPIMGQRAADHIRQILPERRADAAIIAIANHPCPPGAAARLLDGNDPPTRVGAASAANMLAASGDAQAWTPVITRAKSADDLTVRLAAGADQATAGTAAYWSCPSCGQANDIDARECAFCENGTRPSVRRSGERDKVGEATLRASWDPGLG
jgi:Trypsin-like peptidase domain/NACHT domain